MRLDWGRDDRTDIPAAAVRGPSGPLRGATKESS